MNDKIASPGLLQRYRDLWYIVDDQPKWSQPIWRILLVAVPAFIAFDIIMLVYIIIVLILKMNGIAIPVFW